MEYEVTNDAPTLNPTGVWAKNSGQANTKSIADFTFQPDIAARQVDGGVAGTYSFPITTTPLNQFPWQASNPLSFSVGSISPAGSGITANMQATATSATLQVSVAANTPPGNYAIPVTATGGGRTKTASVLVRVGGQPPSVMGLTPNASTQNPQMFTLQASTGNQGIWRVQLLFNTFVTGVNDCSLLLQPDGSGYTVKLSPPDWGTSSWLGPLTIGSAGTLTNGRCTLNSGASSWSTSNGVVSWNLSISRNASWAGAKNAYMLISTNGFEDGWSQIGAWNVP
jgi:hypothetical protein